MKRCSWCNEKNPKYVDYHDHEWGKLQTDDHYLFEMLILESFQAGLSWECVLNKREAFIEAYDQFDIEKVCLYDEEKIEFLNFGKENIYIPPEEYVIDGDTVYFKRGNFNFINVPFDSSKLFST